MAWSIPSPSSGGDQRSTATEPRLAAATPALAAPINLSDVRVIDGDTIRIHHKRPDVRLVGFNAPETVRAACTAEAVTAGTRR